METLRSFSLRLLRGFLGLGFNSPVIRGIEWAAGPLGPRGREVPEGWGRESWWMQISSLHIHPIVGLACLHIATLQRNQPLMKLLLENGADIDVQVRWPIRVLPGPVSAPSRGLALRSTPSVRSGDTHFIRGLDPACFLLRALGDILIFLQEGTSGKTALHLAVETQERSLVQFLLQAGARVDARMLNGCTPLHLAAGRGLKSISSTLREAGADSLLRNVEDETPQDLAEDVTPQDLAEDVRGIHSALLSSPPHTLSRDISCNG